MVPIINVAKSPSNCAAANNLDRRRHRTGRASASSELYSLLKRPDEKHVTERAYENPVFVEDLVRNVATRLNAHPHVTWYKVEAENFESIHNHNAYACIEKAKSPKFIGKKDHFLWQSGNLLIDSLTLLRKNRQPRHF